MQNAKITGLGSYIPESITNVKDIQEEEGLSDLRVKKMGIECVHVADEKETTTYMGIEASKRAIENAGILKDDIDVVIFGVGFIPDYYSWADHAFVQESLGIKNAFAFSVYQGCNSSVLGLKLANSLILSGQHENILIVMGERWNKDLINRWITSPFCYYGDGGGAALISKNNLINSPYDIDILSIEMFTDGFYSMMNYAECGGNALPPTEERVKQKLHFAGPKVIENFWIGKEDMKDNFIRIYLSNQRESIFKAVKKAGLTFNDVKHMVFYNLSEELYRVIFSILGFDRNRTSSHLAVTHGHMGPVDVFHNLKVELEDRRIENGDIVALVSAGIGYTWSCSIIRVNQIK